MLPKELYAPLHELEVSGATSDHQRLLGGRNSSSLPEGCRDLKCPICSSAVDDYVYQEDPVREYSISHCLREFINP